VASVQGQIQLATRLAQSGQYKAARFTLDSALKKNPTSVDALALLGRVAAAQKDYAASIDAFRKAVAQAPRSSDLHFELGNTLAMANDFAGAVEALSKACGLAPRKADQHFNLGLACTGLGDHQAAVEAFRAAVDLKPRMTEGWESLGQSAFSIEDWDTAVSAYQRVFELSPESDDAVVRLSIALRLSGRQTEADAIKNEVIARDPGAALARQLVDMTTGRWKGAAGEQKLLAAHLADPLAPDPVCDLALYFERRGRLPAILPQLIASAVANGDHARVMTMTGQALIEARDFSDQTESILLHADALGGQTHKPCNALAYLYDKRGNLPEALKWYRKAHEHDPTIAWFHSNLLFALRHSSHLTPEELFAEHRRYGEIQEALIAALPLPPVTAADADRQVRIGFVSGDFCEHAVTMFFEPYLDHLDRSQFHVTLYYTLRPMDKATERLRSKADQWRHIPNLTAADGARLVQDDRIDILVDLSGHTAGNGLPIFVRKPAPVQVSMIGYPGTTGLTRMDYRLCNPMDAPYSTERCLPLPLLFRPPSSAPDVVPPPHLECGHLTLGCVNKPLKNSPEALRAWVEIMRRLPDARLKVFAGVPDTTAVESAVVPVMEAAGVQRDRLIFQPRLSLKDFMSALNTLDVVLEPFPYGGGTTAVLTAWMGVPFVALKPAQDAGSFGPHLLKQCHLADLIANTPEDYVSIAVALAMDSARQAELRNEMRSRLKAGFLFDEGLLARMLDKTFLNIWQEHCGAAPSPSS